jgi:hypothetical protein
VSDVCEVLAVMLSSSLWNLRFVVASAGGDRVEVGAMACCLACCVKRRWRKTGWWGESCGNHAREEGRSLVCPSSVGSCCQVCKDPRETKAMTGAALAKGQRLTSCTVTPSVGRCTCTANAHFLLCAGCCRGVLSSCLGNDDGRWFPQQHPCTCSARGSPPHRRSHWPPLCATGHRSHAPTSADQPASYAK